MPDLFSREPFAYPGTEKYAIPMAIAEAIKGGVQEWKARREKKRQEALWAAMIGIPLTPEQEKLLRDFGKIPPEITKVGEAKREERALKIKEETAKAKREYWELLGKARQTQADINRRNMYINLLKTIKDPKEREKKWKIIKEKEDLRRKLYDTYLPSDAAVVIVQSLEMNPRSDIWRVFTANVMPNLKRTPDLNANDIEWIKQIVSAFYSPEAMKVMKDLPPDFSVLDVYPGGRSALEEAIIQKILSGGLGQ